MRTTFRSGLLSLEGELHSPDGVRGAAVICHPHPQYGGDMHNAVVGIAADVFHEMGLATLRFNFRGTGGSEGSFDHGVGEVDDALAAVQHVRESSGVDTVTLAGYSFGSMVALRAGPTNAAVDRIVAIAPPLSFFDLGGLSDCGKVKLFVLADQDQFCDQGAARQQIATLPQPHGHRVVHGADHFFSGSSEGLAAALRQLLGG